MCVGGWGGAWCVWGGGQGRGWELWSWGGGAVGGEGGAGAAVLTRRRRERCALECALVLDTRGWVGCDACRSRLGCQLKVEARLEGLRLHIPSATNNQQPA